jgi:hypothetical protein
MLKKKELFEPVLPLNNAQSSGVEGGDTRVDVEGSIRVAVIKGV